jgi:acetolactate synthase I/II/III large subunit
MPSEPFVGDGVEYRNGGELLVDVLTEAGVDTVFGIVSVHNLPLVEAVAQRLRFVPVRHEATAVSAADAYGRARGGLGCALTSTGIGAGNAAGSLVEALSAGMPVLHVTGQVATDYLGSGRGYIHETKDQLGMLRAVSKHAVTITDTASAAGTLRAAVAAALAVPCGPASVEWPIDLQYLPQRRGDGQLSEAGARRGDVEDAVADERALDDAAAMLAAAKRPLIWAGGGAIKAGGALRELVERLPAGLLTSNAGRGAVPEDHPLCVGNYASAPAGRALLAEADVLLSLGTHFRSNETSDYSLALPAGHIQVDVDPAALGRVYPVKVGIGGRVETVLAHLARRITTTATEPGWRDRVTEAKATARSAQRAAVGPQAAICDALRAILPRDAVVARDVTIPSSTWGNRLLELYSPQSNVYSRGGGIGQGLGMGIGAALARPHEPVAVIAGDGGLAVHLGELLTAAQERPWLVLLVFNDGGYGVLRNMQDRHSGRRAGVDLVTPNFQLLAAAAWLSYARIASADEAEAVLADAVSRREPVLVEVDVEALGPMPHPFTPPVTVPEGERR